MCPILSVNEMGPMLGADPDGQSHTMDKALGGWKLCNSLDY